MARLGITASPYSQDLIAKVIDWNNMKRWIKQQIGAYLSLYDVIFSTLCKAAMQLLLPYVDSLIFFLSYSYTPKAT
jgi:hypothetical protein